MAQQNSKPEKPEPLDPVQQAQLIARKSIDQDINEAHSLLFGAGSDNNQLPKEIFESTFLPFFAGRVKDDPRLKITTSWIGVAGSPMNSVDIIDSEGKVEFTVPPLMSSAPLRERSNMVGSSFNEIFDSARKQSNRVPTLVQPMIGNLAGGKIQAMKVAPNNVHVEQWNKIFKIYGIEQPKGADGKPVNPNVAPAPVDDELDL